RLAGLQVEADTVDRVHAPHLARQQPALDREVLDQLVDAKQPRGGRNGAHSSPWALMPGSRRARRPPCDLAPPCATVAWPRCTWASRSGSAARNGTLRPAPSAWDP